MKYRVIELTAGNIRNDHLYLTKAMDLFPADAIGGSNIESEAPQKLEIHCGIEQPVLTDIAGDKKIFRKRSWVKEFFTSHQLDAGSEIVIEHTGGNRYHIYPRR
ncbi:hypothetical protein H2O73_12180 [Vibrio sp. 404]|uniref:Uncharacterized protein n=1 Tax=Vibrio marinisediminis TaxID=2758441 RepID=A0A7W2FRV0_9VIBR|nr:hypothetical protein [Vibrio marinisediminis]MBA5763110.1 hypothetical protein [Vibrio marinisediminis]